jgi:hypothetical protein
MLTMARTLFIYLVGWKLDEGLVGWTSGCDIVDREENGIL